MACAVFRIDASSIWACNYFIMAMLSTILRFHTESENIFLIAMLAAHRRYYFFLKEDDPKLTLFIQQKMVPQTPKARRSRQASQGSIYTSGECGLVSVTQHCLNPILPFVAPFSYYEQIQIKHQMKSVLNPVIRFENPLGTDIFFLRSILSKEDQMINNSNTALDTNTNPRSDHNQID
ncbi:hypothetical protein F4774DRAFT_398390 [Daldinia eschscholtzii]|nr:hypothetical protein F4774DRAFT_398390 [Daldinia eschscholtzii]